MPVPDIVHFNVGDVLTPIRLQMNQRDGTAKDLSTYTVEFYLYAVSDGSTKVDAGSCTLTNGGSDGRAHYAWDSADIDTAGEYYGYWKLTKDGLSALYPRDGNRLKVVFHSVP